MKAYVMGKDVEVKPIEKLNLTEIRDVANYILRMSKHQLERTICFCNEQLKGY